MSMEDILKVLVDSRQQGSSSSQQSADPMTQLIGGLLGGTPQSAPSGASSGQTGLGDMMGLLESFMGGGGQTGSMNQASAASDPVMMLLQPFVEPLAKKLNVEPQIAMLVVSFVAHKLLAHHPTSGRDSTSFNLDEMLTQMNSGQIDSNLLKSSGMTSEISKLTGMNEADSTKALNAAFTMVGKQLGGGIKRR